MVDEVEVVRLGLLLEEVNPEGLLVQLYELPLTELAPRFKTVFPHTLVSFATFAEGRGLTVIFALLLLVHPDAVTVSVRLYVIVEEGATVILEAVEVNPLGLLVQL